jgi:hypothetical protein
VQAALRVESMWVTVTGDTTIAGLVDGTRRWEITVGSFPINDIRAVGKLLVVRSYDDVAVDDRWHYVRFDADGATELDGVATGFRPAAAEQKGDSTVVLGRIDVRPGGSAGAVHEAALVEFGATGTRTLGSFDVPAFAPLDILGRYVLAGGPADMLRILSIDSLKEVARVEPPPIEPFELPGSNFAVGDDYLVFATDGEVSLWR